MSHNKWYRKTKYVRTMRQLTNHMIEISKEYNTNCIRIKKCGHRYAIFVNHLKT